MKMPEKDLVPSTHLYGVKKCEVEELCDKIPIIMKILCETDLSLPINNLSYEEAISFTQLCNEAIALANKISDCGKVEFYYPSHFSS